MLKMHFSMENRKLMCVGSINMQSYESEWIFRYHPQNAEYRKSHLPNSKFFGEEPHTPPSMTTPHTQIESPASTDGHIL